MLAFSVLYTLLFNIILCLILTLLIAVITLLERKVLAVIQRRVGPNYTSFKGRLQYISDALKLLLKGFIIPNNISVFYFILFPAIALSLCYIFWINMAWGNNISIIELEYNIILMSIFSILFAFCTIFTGYFSKNKYSILAALRACLLVLNIEIFLNLFILNLIFFSKSFSFQTFVPLQEFLPLFFAFFNFSSIILLIFLLEVNRAPFDLSEAESELVAGYIVEYGSFFFAIYYLGEYFHLFFFSYFLSVTLFSGWEFFNFIFIFIINLYSIY